MISMPDIAPGLILWYFDQLFANSRCVLYISTPYSLLYFPFPCAFAVNSIDFAPNNWVAWQSYWFPAPVAIVGYKPNISIFCTSRNAPFHSIITTRRHIVIGDGELDVGHVLRCGDDGFVYRSQGANDSLPVGCNITWLWITSVDYI